MQVVIIILAGAILLLLVLLLLRKREGVTPMTDTGALELLKGQLESAQSELRLARATIVKLTSDLSVAQTELNSAQSKAEELKTEVLNIQNQFKDQFKTLAQNILDEKSKHMQQQSESQIKLLLNPIQENLS
jgi:DNA recombination protein RmuC